MRFTAVFATLAALAVTATAAPASTAALEQAGAVLVAQQADCKNRDSYDICRRNCSPLAPGFACTINCLIAYCP
ncbi:hypothetical protein QIS74_01358 [Colletotrichum tabaci]|uniref:Uncharacterized protein n=1 Tax=Colletotrichum tabaci TaxID=1209068 RepID=A0AAV9TP49_9PEZI